MAEESINYENVIADLEAKRATFNAHVDRAIEGIRHVLSAVAGLKADVDMTVSATSSLSVGTQTPTTVTPDAFFGLSIAEAAIKLLQIVKRRQTTREIAEQLEKANYHHTSKNFINTVNTALYRRTKDEGDVVKISRQWALAEWYPGRRTKAPSDASDKPAVATEATRADGESRDPD